MTSVCFPTGFPSIMHDNQDINCGIFQLYASRKGELVAHASIRIIARCFSLDHRRPFARRGVRGDD